MSELHHKQLTNLESCKRLRALSAFRESQNDLYEAFSVLNDALFYLNPNCFSSNSQYLEEVGSLRKEIEGKQEELKGKLKKPLKVVEGGIGGKMEGKRKMTGEGVDGGEMKENLLVQ